VAVDTSGTEVTFDPTASSGTGVSQESTINYDQGVVNAMTCLSDSQCLAIDSKGREITFNPKGASVSSSTLDSAGNGLIALYCLSASQCVALDSIGEELSFTPGSGATPVLVDPSKQLRAIACSSATSCVAVNGSGQGFVFAPGTSRSPSPVLLDAIPAYSAAGCASASQCTAMDQSGDEVTFDPSTKATVSAAQVDAGGGFIYAVTCPASTQCTAVDTGGNETTFNPQSGAGAKTVHLVNNHPLLALACPSATQCTGVDDDQYEVTFNPQSAGSRSYAALGTAPGVNLTGVACPSIGQCTVVDGSGDAVTFDPRHAGAPKPVQALSGPAVGVSCPQPTECVAVDSGGQRFTFNPQAPAAASSVLVDSAQPTAVDCLTPTYCTVLDVSGRSVEFDPHGAGASVVRTPGSQATLTGLACVVSALCVVVDSIGEAFAGTAKLPPLPRGLGPPTVRGRAGTGLVLRAVHGSWSNAPTGYLDQWERCARAGRACRDIPGATGATYMAVAADTGSVLRVREQASNQAGYGSPAQTSAPTAVVRGLPAAPSVRATLSRPRGRPPSLRIRIRAARYGPELRVLTLSLPGGISDRSRTRLTIRLRRAVTATRIFLGPPGLRLAAALRSKLQHRRPVKLMLVVVLRSRPRSYRAVVPVAIPGFAAASAARSSRTASPEAVLLRRHDLGPGWYESAPAPPTAPSLDCTRPVKRTGAAARAESPTFAQSSQGPFVSELAAVFPAARPAQLWWRRTVTRRLGRCFAKVLASGSSGGVRLKATREQLLPLRGAPAGARLFRVDGRATESGQSTPVYLDVVLIARGRVVVELELSSFESPARASLELRLARTLARRIGSASGKLGGGR
jgi:hypothetical protein